MYGATMRCKVCNQYAPDRCTCNGMSAEQKRTQRYEATGLPQDGTNIELALEKACEVLRTTPMEPMPMPTTEKPELTLKEVWLAIGANPHPDIINSLTKEQVLWAVKAVGEAEAEMYEQIYGEKK